MVAGEPIARAVCNNALESLPPTIRPPSAIPDHRCAAVNELSEEARHISGIILSVRVHCHDDITPSRIETLIDNMVSKKLIDGQLDDSELTLTDLKKVKASFIRVLIGIFHSRIKYPDQQESKE